MTKSYVLPTTNTIKCARFNGPGQIIVTRMVSPTCPPDGVLVEVKSAGICGSDLLMYTGTREQPSNPPGHEFSGTVVKVGETVHDFAVGDRVCVEGFSHCGHCEQCTQGNYNLCAQRVFMPHTGPSGFSEIALVPASALHCLPKKIDFELGALVEPLAVGLHALNRIIEQPVQRLLIIGAGTIGLATLLCAKAKGIENVWIVAKYSHQAELAREFGAVEVLEPRSDVLQFMDDEPDAVINTVTSSEALSQAIRVCCRRGTIVLASGYSVDTAVHLRPMVSKELYLVGSIGYAQSGPKPDFEVIIDWLARGVLRTRSLITHRFYLDDIATAFKVAQDKSTGSVKVHIQVNE